MHKTIQIRSQISFNKIFYHYHFLLKLKTTNIMYPGNSLIIPSSIISPSVQPSIRNKIRNGVLNLSIFGYEKIGSVFNEIIRCIQNVPTTAERDSLIKIMKKLPPSHRPIFPPYAEPILVSVIIQRWGSLPKIQQVFPSLSQHFNLPPSVWSMLINEQNLNFFSDLNDINLVPKEFVAFKNNLEEFLAFKLSLSQLSNVEVKDNFVQFLLSDQTNEAKILTKVTLEKAFQLCKENNLFVETHNFLSNLHDLVSAKTQIKK